LFLEDQLLVLQHPSVLVAEDGEKDLVREMALHRLPVDVEELGVGGAGAVFQHVVPPAIGAFGDSHVVGHDVEDVPHPALVERGDHPVIGLG